MKIEKEVTILQCSGCRGKGYTINANKKSQQCSICKGSGKEKEYHWYYFFIANGKKCCVEVDTLK